MQLFAGAVIAGRYMANRKVGTGSFGEVWAGTHLAIGVKVAIKTLLSAAATDPDAVARLRREAYFLGRIQSDRVARVLDFIADDTFGLVLVIEFVEGELLFDVLKKRHLSVEEAIQLGDDILTGLCDLHAAKVIHRDLKPGNIIMRPLFDGTERAIIFDFSLSRMVAHKKGEEDSITALTRSNMAVGTLQYMAPEQVLNSRQVTERSDIYAVGAILYRAVAGKHVFPEKDVELAQTKLMTEAPSLETGRDDRVALGLEAIVRTALKRKPAQRFGSAFEMLEEVRRLRDVLRAQALSDDEVTRVAPHPDFAHAKTEPATVEVEPSPASSPALDPVTPRRGPRSLLLTAAAVGVFSGGLGLGSVLTERYGWPLARHDRAVALAAPSAPAVVVVDASQEDAAEIFVPPRADAGDAGDAADAGDAFDAALHPAPRPVVRAPPRPRPPVDSQAEPASTEPDASPP